MDSPSALPLDSSAEWPLNPGDFAAYYQYAPTALAIRECLRLRAARTVDLPEPILDIGCGDGVFAGLAYPGRKIWGIDINPTEIRRAQATCSYSTLVCGSIVDAGLPREFFQSAIANCSLEHVPDIHGALRNIRQSLAPGAPFLMMVPTPGWTKLLAVPSLLSKLGLQSLAQEYGAALDRTFNHVHLYDETQWTEILGSCGFEVVRFESFVSRRSSWVFDLALYPSLLGLGTRKVSGRWILAPGLRSLSVDLARKLVDAVAQRIGDDDEGSEYFIVARA